MTIRFLRQWNGYDSQAIATLGGAEEARLVGLGLAVNYTKPSIGPTAKANRALFLGTSITATSLTSVAVGGATEKRTSSNSWVNWFLIAAKQPFTSWINAGVSGNKTTDMVARYAADVEAQYDNFDYLFFEPGPNDTADDATSLATMIANYRTIISKAVNAGKGITAMVPSVHETITTLGKTKREGIIDWLNSAMDEFKTLRVVHLDRVLADPATGTPLSAMFTPTYTEAQRVHLSVQGACAVGRYMAEAHKDLFAIKSRVVLSKRNPRQYLPNPMLGGANASGTNNFSFGGAGAITGTGPDDTAIGIVRGSWGAGSVVVAPKVVTGVDGLPSGGVSIAVAAAPSDQSELRIVFGGYDNSGAFATTHGRMDTNWAQSTAQVVGDHRLLPAYTNGVLTCVVGGTSAGSTPVPVSPTTYGELITDGSITWKWQKKPVAGDTFIAEVEYEITSQTGSFGIDAYAVVERASTANGELWGMCTFPYLEKTLTNPVQGHVGALMPREGVLRSAPFTIADPGVAIRYMYIHCSLVYMNGAAVTIVFKSANLVAIN